jgi:phage terminase large subunit-like protein
MTARDYLALARTYEDDIRAGRIPACKWVVLACERNARDRARERTEAFPYWFDGEAAIAICAAAEQFPHIKGPKAKVIGLDDEGRPMWQTIQLEPWQCWVLTTLFGWLAVDSNLRRFRTGLILVPRKNAKSTIAAVILLFMLGPDGEMGAECYSAATTRPQSKVVASMAYVMAQRTPAYREFFGVKLGGASFKTLEIPELASTLGPLAGDAGTLDGLNVHCATVDELHAHRTRDMWDVLETATGARDESLLLPISTAGVNIAGICYEQLTYVEKILQGVLHDETYFGVNYTIDEGDDWTSPESWKKANPNYGISVSPEDLARKAKKAKASPAAINNFLTKHLNVWVRGASPWMPMPEWHACGDPSLRIEAFAGVPCWIGVDLAEVRDIASLVALFKPEPNRYVVFSRNYLPKDTIDLSPVAQYSGWVHEGHLIETDGNVADYLRLEDDIVTWCQTLNVQAVCFDRALAAMMMQSLQRKLGGTPEILVVNQNVENMNPAMQALERLVMCGDLQHTADPVLTWMASNVVVERNFKDEIYPRKAGGKFSANKIDGVMATLTALWVAERTDGSGATAYDDDGIFTV